MKSPAWFVLAAAVSLLVAQPGCVRQQKLPPNALTDGFSESAAMLLAPEPYKTICLEVDSVEGAPPSKAAADALAAFLHETCNKPVSVIMKEPIPAAQAKGVPPHIIALEHMQGPPAGEPNHPAAYVYVLLYRGAGDWKRAGYASFDYPCSMFIDTAALGPTAKSQLAFSLKHEVGHMMTLCSDKAHGDGMRCNNKSCLMYEAFSISRTFLGLQHAELCEACRRDLAEARKSARATSLKFEGSFIVRRQQGYLVAKMPGAVHVQIGEADKFDWRAALGTVREQLREIRAGKTDAYRQLVQSPKAAIWSSRWEVETKEQYVRAQPAIAAACKDPDPRVRQIAEDIRKKLDGKFGRQAATGPGAAL